MLRLALYQPDIPQNTGSILRLASCFGVPVDIIEPCGFPFSHKGLKRAGMDYVDQVDIHHHLSWTAFDEQFSVANHRLILLSTAASTPYFDYKFSSADTLLLGRESAGVPDEVHQRADARLVIPITRQARSLNVAQAASIVLSEALRQLGDLDKLATARPTTV